MTSNSKPTPAPRADIKTLVDRYMEGATTNDEEAALRSWFASAGDSVPDEWRPLRAMLAFVDSQRSLLPAQDARYAGDEAEAPRLPAGDARQAPRHARLLRAMRRPRLWVPSAVAAAAVAVALLVPRIGGAEPQSYAVIDGKVYTNPKVVREQAMDALDAVSADAEDPFGALDMMQ